MRIVNAAPRTIEFEAVIWAVDVTASQFAMAECGEAVRADIQQRTRRAIRLTEQYHRGAQNDPAERSISKLFRQGGDIPCVEDKRHRCKPQSPELPVITLARRLTGGAIMKTTGKAIIQETGQKRQTSNRLRLSFPLPGMSRLP